MMKRKLVSAMSAVVLALSLAAATAHATDGSVRASGTLSVASASVAAGSVMLASGTGELVVQSIEATGDVVSIVAKGVSEASTVTLQLSAEAAGALSLAAGSIVVAVAESAGTLLTHAGKVIAFIPNELGRELLHSQRISSGG